MSYNRGDEFTTTEKLGSGMDAMLKQFCLSCTIDKTGKRGLNMLQTLPAHWNRPSELVIRIPYQQRVRHMSP